MNDGGLRLRVKKGAKKDDILIRFPLKTSGKNTNIHRYKYTSIQIYKYTTMQIYKYTNIEIYKGKER